MLWTDADFISADDLTSLDNEVLAVATAEGIALEDNGTGTGVIHRAIEEAGDALLKHLQEFGGASYGAGDVSANHYMAIMNTGLAVSNRTRVLLTQVIVTGNTPRTWTPLKRWAVYWSLMLFYRDAANRTNNDRYSEKEDGYRRHLHGTYWAAVRSLGLPVVFQPLPCPGALYEPEAGFWGTSNVVMVPGAGTVTGTYDVAITFVDGGRSSNNESGPSQRVTVDLTPGSVLRVLLDGLMPPTGTQPACTRAQAVVPYGRATHWNVYAGLSGETLKLQSSTALDITTTAFTFSGDPATATTPVGTGQYPDTYMAFHNWNQRG